MKIDTIDVEANETCCAAFGPLQVRPWKMAWTKAFQKQEFLIARLSNRFQDWWFHSSAIQLGFSTGVAMTKFAS